MNINKKWSKQGTKNIKHDESKWQVVSTAKISDEQQQEAKANDNQ
jgi:hypothetical protein